MSNASRWPTSRQSRAMYWGLAASLLLHAALLHLFSQHEPAPSAADHSAAAGMALFLLPAPQPRLPPVQVQRLEPPAETAAPRSGRRLVSEGSKQTTAPAAPIANQAIQAEERVATTPSAARPRLDIEAAIRMAGKIAKDPDSMRDDRAIAQLKSHPLEGNNPDSRLAQEIQRGARADCLQSESSKGLLAPLFLVADAVLSKKDGGCKW